RTGIPNLYAYSVAEDALFQITNVLSGAVDPDVSPDGRPIVLSYYRADGYHIARIPFDPGSWWPASPPRPEALPLGAPRAHAPVGGEARRYSAWPTVAPAAWSFIPAGGTELGAGVGVALGGADVV